MNIQHLIRVSSTIVMLSFSTNSWAQSNTIVNNQTVIIDNLRIPNPFSSCEAERNQVNEFQDRLRLMLSSDVDVRFTGKMIDGIPVVQLWNHITNKDASEILIQDGLGRRPNQNWCD